MSHPAKFLLTLLGGLILLSLVSLSDPSSVFAAVKAQREQLAGLVAAHPWVTACIFFVIYAASVALILPWAALLSITAGAIFGPLYGTLLAVGGATAGATCAFLGARHLLRARVQRRFQAYLAIMDDGIEREGGFYLFALRLVAWLPFFLINPLMGLTPMRVRTFFWVTLIGMMPVTAVWVNAGTQLGRIETLEQLVSPAVLLSFTLIGLLPLVAKRLVAAWRRRHS